MPPAEDNVTTLLPALALLAEQVHQVLHPL
jgi:hypothetical protein